MRRHPSAFYPKHTFIPGLDTIREFPPYAGFQKLHIYYFRVLWTVVSNYGRFMAKDVVCAHFRVIVKLLRMLRGTTMVPNFYLPHMIVILNCGMPRLAMLYHDLQREKCHSVLNFIRTTISNIYLWQALQIRRSYV